MIWLKFFVAALLFVASTGVFFSDRFRTNRLAVLLAGAIAVASTFYLFRDSLFELNSNSRPPAQQTTPAVSPPEKLPEPLKPKPPASPDIAKQQNSDAVFPISKTWVGMVIDSKGVGHNVAIYRDLNTGELIERYKGCVERLVPRSSSRTVHEYAAFVDMSSTGWGTFPDYWCKAFEVGEKLGEPGKGTRIVLSVSDNPKPSISYVRYFGTNEVWASGLLQID